MSAPLLTVLSFGGGQDSTTLLYKYVHDDDFRQRYAPGDFVVVMSDTGDEHVRTYAHVLEIRQWCADYRIDFYHLTPDMGFHSENWQGLREFYRSKNTVGSKAFPKTCTDQLKIRVIYRWLNDYVGEEYGFQKFGGIYRGKAALVEFARNNGKIRMLLGIAAGEETRVANADSGPKWMQLSIDRCYPLIDLGLDRKGCQDYIREAGYPVPQPSNCILCPYMNLVELLWLYRFHPDDYNDWVEIEANKLAANMHKGDQNLGVFGKKTLPEALAEAMEKHGHMTDEDLEEYKMSHGHCVKSKY